MKHRGLYTQAWGAMAELPPGSYKTQSGDFGSTPVVPPQPPPPPPPPPGSLSIALELPGAISFPEVLDDDWDW